MLALDIGMCDIIITLAIIKTLKTNKKRKINNNTTMKDIL